MIAFHFQSLKGSLIADIPRPGTRFAAGEPVLTVFARGRGLDECQERLARRVARWRAWLGENRGG